MLIFGDIGIDDIMALLYGALNQDIDIIGVVADYGNISRKNALASVNYIRQLLNITTEFPIIVGAETPMTGEEPTYFPEIHGEFGLGPITPPQINGEGVSENFFDIVSIINKYENELIIVNIGRLTSLATMFILYRELMGKVSKYYIMGGAFWVPGNVTSVSEANIYGDPFAANVVLKYAEDLTIIPLNVTQQAVATPEMINYIDKVGQIDIIKPMVDFYFNYYKARDPRIQGSPMHDVLTLMAVLYDDMFTYYYLPVYIPQSLTGSTRGQTIADIRSYVTKDTDEDRKFRIAFQLDYESFYTHFMTTMTRPLSQIPTNKSHM